MRIELYINSTMLFSYVNLSEDRRNVVSPLNSTNNKDGAGGQTPGFSM